MNRSLGVPALLALALAALTPCRAQVDDDTWEDPTLQAAVADADLVILGEATAVNEGTAAYKVLKTFKGPAQDGGEVLVTGLDLPAAGEGAGRPIPVGDRAYLLLRAREDSAVLAVPTSTFGRFPLQESGTVIGSFSDTFVRVAVPQQRWERALDSIVRGAASPALLTDARALLANKAADANDVYVALEILSMFGEEQDRGGLEALLDDARFSDATRYRIRVVVANALGRLGGAASVRRLVRMLEQDAVDVVKSVAASNLGPVLERLQRDGAEADLVRETTERLATIALTAPAAPLRASTASDRRENQIDGPLGAILKTLSTVRARAGIPAALRALERTDDPDALVAGLTFFQILKDPAQAGAIAFRMRQPDAEDVYFNPLFVRVLEELTGQRVGDDRASWVRWCRQRDLLPNQPDAPLGPPQPPGGGQGGR